MHYACSDDRTASTYWLAKILKYFLNIPFIILLNILYLKIEFNLIQLESATELTPLRAN